MEEEEVAVAAAEEEQLQEAEEDSVCSLVCDLMWTESDVRAVI